MVKPKSFHLQWHITEKCNFKCKHCYTEGPMEELSTQELFMVLDQYIDLIKKWGIIKNKRPRRTSITGGEPLLRKDLFKLLERIKMNKDLDNSVIVMSNGSIINKVVAKKLKDLGVYAVQISLDGMEKENDRIRGRGSFKKAVGGIKELIENGLRVGVSVTLHKRNVKDIPKMIELCKKLGVKSIGIGRLVNLGGGKSLDILDPLELRDFYRYLMKIKAKEKAIFIGTHCSDSLCFIEDSKYKTHGCSAGYDSFSILPNGDVVPCRRLPIKVGNVLENQLFDIWYNSKTLWDLRNRNMVNEMCKKCEVFGKCSGGAKCVANGYFGNPFAPDPQCWKMFKKLPNPAEFSVEESAKNFIMDDRYVEDF